VPPGPNPSPGRTRDDPKPKDGNSKDGKKDGHGDGQKDGKKGPKKDAKKDRNPNPKHKKDKKEGKGGDKGKGVEKPEGNGSHGGKMGRSSVSAQVKLLTTEELEDIFEDLNITDDSQPAHRVTAKGTSFTPTGKGPLPPKKLRRVLSDTPFKVYDIDGVEEDYYPAVPVGARRSG
jgi:hypothetical protein